jgi:hypothetical protein
MSDHAQLDQPLTHSPLVLAKQHAAKLLEPGRRIVERAQDALPVVDRQCDDGDLPVQGVLQQAAGRLVDQAGKVADELRSKRKGRRASSRPGYVSLLTASALVDLRCCDLRLGPDVDAGHASTNHVAAEEAHYVDDLAHRGQLLAAVLVEHVDRTWRVVRDERDAVGPHLVHNGTMSGQR